MNAIIVDTLGFLGLLAALLIWLYGHPASEADRADLISYAGDDVAAQDFVRSVLARKRLQRREVVAASRVVERLKAKSIIHNFTR